MSFGGGPAFGKSRAYVEAGPGFLTEQQDIVDEALVLIGDLWPSAHASVLASVRRVIFLDPTADKPGYTAHQSRGLVWARPGEPHELAQVLVHEGGHNILCSVIDLCALADNQREAVESPFGDDRPVYGVLHAAISFARESLFARMLLERGHRTSLGYDLAEYAADVTALARTSIGRLEEDAQLTSLGADLVRGIAHQALV
jgi:HEXXH motif-containing protein